MYFAQCKIHNALCKFSVNPFSVFCLFCVEKSTERTLVATEICAVLLG